MQSIHVGIKFLLVLLLSLQLNSADNIPSGLTQLTSLAKESSFTLRENSDKHIVLVDWNPINSNSGDLTIRVLALDGLDILVSNKKIDSITLSKILGQKDFSFQIEHGLTIKTLSPFDYITDTKTGQITPTLEISIIGNKTKKITLAPKISLKHQIDIATLNLLQLWDVNPSNSTEEQLYNYDLFRPGFSNWYDPKIYLAKIANLIQELRVMGLPDIVALQELESASNNAEHFLPNSVLSLELKKLGYNYSYLGIQEESNPVALTTGFISKYKMENGSVPFNTKTDEFSLFSEKDKHIAGYTTRDIQVGTITLGKSIIKIYNNHWRSQGCSSPSNCEFSLQVRVANAKLLKKKIEDDKKKNPNTDIILAGDFNCNYLDTPFKIFGNISNEKQMQQIGENSLYNLWHELIPEKRWEASHGGKNDTLSHLFINNNLYDNIGFQYLDNSFRVIGHHGAEKKLLLNVDGTPFRWQEIRVKPEEVSKRDQELIQQVMATQDCNGKKANKPKCRPIYTDFTGDGFGDHLPLITSFYFVGERPLKPTTFSPTSFEPATKEINTTPDICSTFEPLTDKINLKTAKGGCYALNFNDKPIELNYQGIYQTPFLKIGNSSLGISMARSFDPRKIVAGQPINTKSEEMDEESDMCFARKILQGRGGKLKSIRGILGFQNGLPTLFALNRSDIELTDLPEHKKSSCVAGSYQSPNSSRKRD